MEWKVTGVGKLRSLLHEEVPMEYEYEMVCGVCDAAVTLIVKNSEEKPTHCPMCGTPSIEEWED